MPANKDVMLRYGIVYTAIMRIFNFEHGTTIRNLQNEQKKTASRENEGEKKKTMLPETLLKFR